MKNQSLFIPAVPAEIATRRHIRAIVEAVLNLGVVLRVDIVKSPTINPSAEYMAFVHFKHPGIMAKQVRNEIARKGFYDHTFKNRYGNLELFSDHERMITLRFVDSSKTCDEVQQEYEYKSIRESIANDDFTLPAVLTLEDLQ